MAGNVVANHPAASFEFELVEGDSGESSTVVVASSNPVSPWIDPAVIKLRHRIGRGPFGDLWLATHHRISDDYEEYHEVAVKVLHPVKEEHIRDVLSRLDDVLSRCQGLETVCWLHGFTVINNKVSLVFLIFLQCIRCICWVGLRRRKKQKAKVPVFL